MEEEYRRREFEKKMGEGNRKGEHENRSGEENEREEWERAILTLCSEISHYRSIHSVIIPEKLLSLLTIYYLS